MPIIDRDIIVKRRMRKHRINPLTLRFLCILLIAMIFASIIIIIRNDKGNDEGQFISTFSYTKRSTISIFGNNGFKGSNSSTGVSWGNGTANNPYIIKGWEIDAHGNDSGIYISTSTVYFKIVNCLIYNASWEGIYLAGVRNGQVMNNNCTSCGADGILLNNCQKCLVFNNTCSKNSAWGIRLQNSHGIHVSNNYCTNNGAASPSSGIYILTSYWNDIEMNVLYKNPMGILLMNSDLNNITLNNCSTNDGFGISITPGPSGSENNTIWNNTFYNNNGAGSVYNPAKAQGSDTSKNNRWNGTSGYGNWWSDLTAPDNVPPYGIVDWSYNLTGSAASKDYLPLTSKPSYPPIPEFGTIIVPVMAALLVALTYLRKRRRD